MMRKKIIILISVIVVLALAAAIYFITNDPSSGPPYTSSSTGYQGTSLLFDTLQHMGYPVGRSRVPLTASLNTSDVHIIIQPMNPWVNRNAAHEMLDWVHSGGRLIFLQNSNIMDNIAPAPNAMFEGLSIHEIGDGILVTGRALDITNAALVENYRPGAAIEQILSTWNADRILFAEYYHGMRENENTFASLPLVVRLIFVQLVIAAIAFIWFLGKRFGNPIPYYQETERGENEHIHAVVRLLLKGKK